MPIVGPLKPEILGRLTAIEAVETFRELLYCEARHARIRADAITISTKINDPDGGIDAQFNWSGELPADTFLRSGRIGFQIKTGTSFKPWQQKAMKNELLTPTGELDSEVQRTIREGGTYSLLCFGHDFSPEQRNDIHSHIVVILAGFGFDNIASRVEVLGQAQIAGYIQRYPSLRLTLLGGSDDGFLSVEAWSQHAHMCNEFLPSEEQTKLMDQIREHLRGDAKHLRILGEPGIGKTRLILEAVRVEDISANTIYVQHGEEFSKSGLFNEIIRSSIGYPLVIVIDELPSRELVEIWAHLKHRCCALKLVSIDHGPDRNHDSEIQIIKAPSLPDQTIRAILASHVGDRHELSRWVEVCEGSPRVAQAVGENLAANPEDILRAPATVPLWERFLHGYARHDSLEAQQTARVMRHLALFARFGFEDPVSNEAAYIAKLVEKADHAVTWAIFQEIVQTVRDRRILQGSHTLFIVPRALHINLWREFWRWHGRGFDFVATFTEMPETLHGWFMEMFRYAHDSEATRIIKDILRSDGIFSNRDFLGSAKGASLLDALAEADPDGVLKLLERTLGMWSPEELAAISGIHQNFVWILGKLAVWKPTVLGAIRLLAKLALVEKSNFSNNAVGTLSSLFMIGLEWAATEASPKERLPALLEMLRSKNPEMQRLGLKVAVAALKTYGGSRIVGPEYQGIRERANLWKPATYGDWFDGYRLYWSWLVDETRHWSDTLRSEANSAIMEAAGEQLRVEPQVEPVLTIIERLAEDPATDRRKLNRFIIRRLGRFRDKDNKEIFHRLRRLDGKLSRQNLETRFRRYVLDTTWGEWGDLETGTQEDSRPAKLLRALAGRIARNRGAFESLVALIAASTADNGALFAFGEELCKADQDFCCLGSLLANWKNQEQSQALRGYFSSLRRLNPELWQDNILNLLFHEKTAVYGAELVWSSGFTDHVFDAFLYGFERGWLKANSLRNLTLGKAWQNVAPEKLTLLLELLSQQHDRVATGIMVELLDRVLADDRQRIDPDLLFRIVTSPAHFQDQLDNMHSYHWRNVCDKMLALDRQKVMPLLDVLLEQMRTNFRLSYDHYMAPMMTKLCHSEPDEAWQIVAKHLLSSAPKWRGDVLEWMKGGLGFFGEKETQAPLVAFPAEEIFKWIAENPETRASMMAHAVPGSLEDEKGGAVTRHLLEKYSDIDGVLSGISATFHSGGWTGPRSQYLRKKRTLLRNWLSKGYESKVVHWIEHEIGVADKEIDNEEISEERENWKR